MRSIGLALLIGLGCILAGYTEPNTDLPPDLATRYQRAEGRDADAQFQLGMRYLVGHDVLPDESVALNWIGRAADQGHAAAQYQLGSYYTLEPHRDFRQAADLLKSSARQGYAPAQFSVAMLHLIGAGVPHDRIEAYAWLLLAAPQGDQEGIALQWRLQAEPNADELREAQQRAWQYTSRRH